MSSKSHLLYFNNVNNRLSTYENVSCIRKKAAVNCESQKNRSFYCTAHSKR